MGCGCNKRVTHDRRPAPPAGPHVDPTAALAASAGSARYLVVQRRDTARGKQFSTLDAAQDYARRTGGVIRHL